MSPRPRTVDDCTILEAALRVLGRVGPERLTLADVGAEAGLSAATLVQRFGSKREMLLCLFRHGTDAAEARFATAMTSSESPLESLYAAAMDRVGARDGPVTLSNRLAFFLSQVGDPDFHSLAVESWDKAIDGYRAVVEMAIEAGELSEEGLDPAHLASTIHTMTFGSLVTWSIYRRGSLRTKVRNDLENLLNPYRHVETAGLSRNHNESRQETKRRASPPAAA